MTGHSGWSDGAIALIYICGPIVMFLFRGDKKTTPIDGLARNT